MLTFDGSSGDRNYSYAPPEELYMSTFKINTGKSVFKSGAGTYHHTEKKKVVLQQVLVYLSFSE